MDEFGYDDIARVAVFGNGEGFAFEIFYYHPDPRMGEVRECSGCIYETGVIATLALNERVEALRTAP